MSARGERMAKFRKRSAVVEAEQWFPEKCVAGVTKRRATVREAYMPPIYGEIITHRDGLLNVMPGDWIITMETGEKFVCKCAEFTKTYEPVEDDDAER